MPLPTIVITPVAPPVDTELSEAYRRYLSQEPDPFAEQCVYLTDDEIREHLHWDELEATTEEWKQKFFDLCCNYREIFCEPREYG